jgi:hypothetical protein
VTADEITGSASSARSRSTSEGGSRRKRQAVRGAVPSAGATGHLPCYRWHKAACQRVDAVDALVAADERSEGRLRDAGARLADGVEGGASSRVVLMALSGPMCFEADDHVTFSPA